MWGFPVFMWLVFLTFFVLRGRRRRWRRFGHPWDHEPGMELNRPSREDDVQLLEVRLARLEERLEFTEKLLMERPAKPD
jgi:hypothetical protein